MSPFFPGRPAFTKCMIPRLQTPVVAVTYDSPKQTSAAHDTKCGARTSETRSCCRDAASIKPYGMRLAYLVPLGRSQRMGILCTRDDRQRSDVDSCCTKPTRS